MVKLVCFCFFWWGWKVAYGTWKQNARVLVYVIEATASQCLKTAPRNMHWVFYTGFSLLMDILQSLLVTVLCSSFCHLLSPIQGNHNSHAGEIQCHLVACIFFAHNQPSITRQSKMVFIYKKSGMLLYLFLPNEEMWWVLSKFYW